MSTTTTTYVRTHRMFNWDKVKQRIAEWQHRSRSRQELESLSDSTVRDIGITRWDVHRESHERFWMA